MIGSQRRLHVRVWLALVPLLLAGLLIGIISRKDPKAAGSGEGASKNVSAP